MDKEEEILHLKKKLNDLNTNIRTELRKIDQLKLKITSTYRRRDKENYETERRTILENLKKYEAETAEVRRRLSELEGI